jgi:MFS family permease
MAGEAGIPLGDTVEAVADLRPPAAPSTAPWPDPVRAWYTIWLIAFVTLLSNVDATVINVLIQPIKHDLHLSDFAVSMLTSAAYTVPYLLTGYPVSRISDVHSRRWVLGIGLFFWSLGTVLSGLARGFNAMFGARAVVGSSESLPGPAALSMMSDLVPPAKLPRAFAVYSAGIGIGMALGQLLGGLLLGHFLKVGHDGNVVVPLLGSVRAWQLVFITLGLPGLVTVVLWMTTVREPVRRGRDRPEAVPILDVLRYLAKHRAIFLPMFLSIILSSIELFGAATWRIPMFERTYGWSAASAGFWFGLVTITTMPFSLTGGTMLAEHLIRKGDAGAMLRISFLADLCYFPFSVLAPLMPNPWLSFGMLFTAAAILGISSPALNAAIQFVAPNEMRGQISALYLVTIRLGTLLGPIIVASVSDFFLKDESHLNYAMSLFALCLGPVTIWLRWLSVKPFGTEVRRRGVI